MNIISLITNSLYSLTFLSTSASFCCLILTFACEGVLQEGNKNLDYDVILSTPEKRLDELVHLAELCIEVHQQNEEYHSEVT